MFIAIEGIDGAGKETQAKRLADYFHSLGKEVLYLDFPAYNSMVGKEIGKLLAAKDDEVNANTIPPKVMSLLFAMDRLQFKDKILEAQAAGKVIISNRYVMSSVVLQTARGKAKLADWIYQLEHVEMGLPKPDCYIVLTGDVSVTKTVKGKQARDYTSGEDQYESNQTLMVKTAEMYGRVALPGSTTLTVNCIKDGWFREKNDITEDIISKLNKFIRE